MEGSGRLTALRTELDTVDRELVALYEKRMRLCKEVAEDKLRTGKAVLDSSREQQKLDSVASLVESDFDKKAVQELYRQLMTLSRRLQLRILREQKGEEEGEYGFRRLPKLVQNGKRVVYQGIEGAYAEQAARKSFSEDCLFFHVKTWREAMEAVRQGEADYAVLPVENSSYGTVTDTLDLLLEYPEAVIAGETELRIEHALLGLPGAAPEMLRRVYSHPQALGQCGEFFREHPEISAVPVLNTAEAARLVAERGDPAAGALASERSAALYGLTVLKSAVNSYRDNLTRFLTLGKERVYFEGAEKVSLCFEAGHRPGALYNILGNFIFNDVNMCRIQSRPIPERAFEYRFFVDIEGGLWEDRVRNALSGIQDQTAELRILGCY